MSLWWGRVGRFARCSRSRILRSSSCDLSYTIGMTFSFSLSLDPVTTPFLLPIRFLKGNSTLGFAGRVFGFSGDGDLGCAWSNGVPSSTSPSSGEEVARRFAGLIPSGDLLAIRFGGVGAITNKGRVEVRREKQYRGGCAPLQVAQRQLLTAKRSSSV
jgi:hypothetical protein